MRKVRYILTTKSSGVVTLTTDPDGWKDDERQIVRDSKYYGLIYEFAGELNFSQDGYDIITQELLTNGHNANILLRRDRLNYNDEWELDYIGALDVTTKKENDSTISFKLSDAGLTKTIKAQFNEKFELDRLDSVNGTTITDLTYDTITLTGRNLLIDSKLDDLEAKSPILSNFFNTTVEIDHIPSVNKVFSGDEKIGSVFPFPQSLFSFQGNSTPFNSTHFFYLNSDIEKTIEVKVKYNADVIAENAGDDYSIFFQ
jgi:hypothetical protein